MKDLIWRNLSKQIPIEEASFSHHLKGLFTDFAVGMHGSVSISEIRFTLIVFNLFYTCGRIRLRWGGTKSSTSNGKRRGWTAPLHHKIDTDSHRIRQN